MTSNKYKKVKVSFLLYTKLGYPSQLHWALESNQDQAKTCPSPPFHSNHSSVSFTSRALNILKWFDEQQRWFSIRQNCTFGSRTFGPMCYIKEQTSYISPVYPIIKPVGTVLPTRVFLHRTVFSGSRRSTLVLCGYEIEPLRVNAGKERDFCKSFFGYKNHSFNYS